MRLLKKRFRPHIPVHVPGGAPSPTRHVFGLDYAEQRGLPLKFIPSQTKLVTPLFPLNRGANFEISPVTIDGKQQTYHLRSNFVTRLPKGRVVGHFSMVLTEENELVVESTALWRDPISTLAVFWGESLPPIRKVDERIAIVSSPDQNFFHWCVNTLPRIEMLRQSGEPYDRLYLSPFTSPFQLEALSTLGISLDKVIMGHPGAHLEASELVVTSLPSYPCDFTPFAIDFLRRTFLTTKSKSRKRRLYVTRCGAAVRLTANEKRVFAALEKRGFEWCLLDHLTMAEQASLFASAEAIVAPHGAALTNLAYCNAGTKLVEIYHPDWIVDCFWQASQYLAMEHHVFVADPAYRKHGFLGKRSDGTKRDIWVDVQRLEDVLDKAGL